jgi:hypothetical protein|tara:strand:- start:664 stop:876 length:213 start_codon:yes stop_codon:yes gene_type:complete
MTLIADGIILICIIIFIGFMIDGFVNYLANIPESHGFYWFMIIAIGFFTLIDYVFFWFTGYELFPPGFRM